VATNDLTALVRVAETAGAKLVLVDDHRRLRHLRIGAMERSAPLAGVSTPPRHHGG